MLTATEARDKAKSVHTYNSIIESLSDQIDSMCNVGGRKIIWMATDVDDTIRTKVIDFLTNARYYVRKEEFKHLTIQHWYSIEW